MGMATMTICLWLMALSMSLLACTADYTLDDSFWTEENPVADRATPSDLRNMRGEVERLMREYHQNQEMVRNIGSHYYQIIYPVQLRHHEKMGISTREVGKQRGGGYGDGGGYSSSRGRSRTGKHYHRTSLLIKAFNHKFRLDLELNTQLLAPNLMQKHFLPSGAEQVSKQIEHCYYHGTVKDYPGASAAFHTCNGVSGVIHLGNETFVIHPFYGGDLSKHPHVIFEAKTRTNKGCGNHGNLEWGRLPGRRTTNTHLSGLTATNQGGRFRRDVREATKYIETAMVIDKAMFEKRNGSTRTEVVHDAIQVANIADLYFRTLNTRVSVVYIETWQGTNQASIDRAQDVSRALMNFNDYTSRKLFKVDKDTTQLLTGENFQGGEAGMAVPDTVCTPKAVGISVDVNPYEPHLLAGTMAHMIGHNIGMGHDDGREECYCHDWHGCIMAQSIIGLENVQPYKFSECSRSDYIDMLRVGKGICLLNKPNELDQVRNSCGNNIVEEGEECDCGTIDECHERDPCCDPITCKLTKEAECASGPCCSNCRLQPRGLVCRESSNECDLPEHCNGETGQCPPDVHKKNGSPCGGTSGYCFNGNCPTLSIQCEHIWGYGGIAGDPKCFEQFNSKGSINGHCGSDGSGGFLKCDPENVRCGSLQCQMGNRFPVLMGMDHMFARTIISIRGVEYECKSSSGQEAQVKEVPPLGLVRDGTPCGDNLICVNQTCTSIFPHIDQGKCPSNHNNLECSGHGVCSNLNRCYCEVGWSGADCSIQVEMALTPYATSAPPGNSQSSSGSKLDMIMEKKETPYENAHSTNTVFLVVILMSVVGGVFIVFALMALCYRSVVVRGSFLLCLSSEQQGHKLQQLHHGGNRLQVPGGLDPDGLHSGEDETVSFIDLPPNNLSKLPEKGILKKSACGGYGTVSAPGDGRQDKWDDSQSDNQEILSQSDNNLVGSGAISEVERTLKSLNGYHEDILEALRNAASHRGIATPSGSSSLLSEEILRKSIAECSGYGGGGSLGGRGSVAGSLGHGSQERVCDAPTHTVLVEGGHRGLAAVAAAAAAAVVGDPDDSDEVPPSCGPIRIRNLEDLIRQLEHHSRHMSPSGSEDIRMSETEADRHYRLESASDHPGRCRSGGSGGSGDEPPPRFVYGRYRQPPPGSRHHSHHHLAEEESLYESADRERGPLCEENPDSESTRRRS